MKIYGIFIQEELYLCNLQIEIVLHDEIFQFPPAHPGSGVQEQFGEGKNEDINMRRYVSSHD